MYQSHQTFFFFFFFLLKCCKVFCHSLMVNHWSTSPRQYFQHDKTRYISLRSQDILEMLQWIFNLASSNGSSWRHYVLKLFPGGFCLKSNVVPQEFFLFDWLGRFLGWITSGLLTEQKCQWSRFSTSESSLTTHWPLCSSFVNGPCMIQWWPRAKINVRISNWIKDFTIFNAPE